MMTPNLPAGSYRFIASYQGAADYQIGAEHVEIRYRAFTDHHPFRPEVFESEIVPCVGTLRNRDDITKWPSARAIAAFPAYVPARWNGSAIEYLDGRAPRVERDRFGFLAIDDERIQAL